LFVDEDFGIWADFWCAGELGGSKNWVFERLSAAVAIELVDRPT